MGEAEAGGRKFVLIHGGLGNFWPDKGLHDYRRDGLTWRRPEPDTAYFPDKLVVVGHTPARLMYNKAGRLTSAAKLYRTDSFIDVDCGCVFQGGRLGCLCLDTMEEIYMRKNRPPKELFAVHLTNGSLYDRLNRLAAEYSLPAEALAELAVKRFVEDVALFRSLRSGRLGGSGGSVPRRRT